MGFPTADLLLDHIYDGVYYVDPDRQILYWNKAAERISGYKREEIVGNFCFNNYLRHINEDGLELCFHGCPLNATMQDGEPREALVFLHHKDGYRVPVHVRVSPVRNETGQIIGGVEVFSEYTEAIDTINFLEKYKQESFTDPLLGIGNRRYGDTVLQSRHHELRQTGVPYAVAFIDLDDFKNVNDQYGHAAGDDLLRMIAQAISKAVREPDTVVRWGGDEFLVILPKVGEESLMPILKRVLLLVTTSELNLMGEVVRIKVSIGATAATAQDTVQSVIARADQLMYTSKQNGKGRISIG